MDMRFILLVASFVLVLIGAAEAHTKWIKSDDQSCDKVCRVPVTVGGRSDAFVCAGHVKGAPPTEIRSGMNGAGSRHCYVPGEAARARADGPFLCLCSPF
jgi:hypothetical protein